MAETLLRVALFYTALTPSSGAFGIMASWRARNGPRIHCCSRASKRLCPSGTSSPSNGGNAYGFTLRAIFESEGDWVIKFLGLRDGDSSLDHRCWQRPFIMFGISLMVTTLVDERLPTVAVEQFHLFLPDLPHERSRAIKIGPFWYKTDICFGSSIAPKLLQFRQCDHALQARLQMHLWFQRRSQESKCIDASELPPLQLRGPD